MWHRRARRGNTHHTSSDDDNYYWKKTLNWFIGLRTSPNVSCRMYVAWFLLTTANLSFEETLNVQQNSLQLEVFFLQVSYCVVFFSYIYIFSIIGESEQLWPMSSVCTRKRKKTAALARFAQNVWKGEKNCTERRRHTRTPSQVALFSCLLQHIIFVRCPSTRSSLSLLVLLIFFSAPFQLMNLLGREFSTVSSRDCVKKNWRNPIIIVACSIKKLTWIISGAGKFSFLDFVASSAPRFFRFLSFYERESGPLEGLLTAFSRLETRN